MPRENILFPGVVPHSVLRQLFQISAAHLYLTYPFVLSWSVLEAMACGALVIGSDTAPVREVIRPGRNGLLVPFFDADALAEAILGALRSPEQHIGMRAAARRTVERRFRLRDCLDRQQDILESMSEKSLIRHVVVE
jgi:glycosyltransferase involved in cell wall biosynthesis